jgi:prephenate dehydrogenase
VPNRPGVVAQIALEMGRAGINITDMSLATAADNRTAVIGQWETAADAERASDLIAALGFPAEAEAT